MDAQERTEALRRESLPVGVLIPNEDNPNEMSDAEFNMLCDNVERVGVTDPILVRDLGDGTYRVVGGHHRLEAAKMFDFEKVPCTIIDDPEFDEDMEKFQLVRHNVIRGRMTPQKFMNLYEKLAGKYADDIMAESFGFVDEDEFKKLIQQTASQLPKEMQQEFKEAAKEIKTIDGLAALLNRMFSMHGDTLPYGYMVVDFGGHDSIWLRMDGKGKENFMTLATRCRKSNRAVDHVVASLLKLIATDEEVSFKVQELLDATPVVDVSHLYMPTLDEKDNDEAISDMEL